jgi:hypothetical protein
MGFYESSKMTKRKNNRPSTKDIVAYPIMDEGDCEWIQELRRLSQEHPRPAETIICPYFSFHEQLTVDDEDLDIFLKTLQDKFKNFHAFNFTIRDSLVFEDDIAGYFVGLVALEGLREFLCLSSLIYATVENINNSNVFQSIYLPYIHIAYRRYYKDTKVVMDKLRQQEIVIQGRIEKLSIEEFEGNSRKIIHEINLKP